MFGSIRTRLWLTYAIVIASVLVTLFVTISIYLIRNPYIVRQYLQRLQLVNTLLVQRDFTIINENSQQLENSIQKADKAFDVRVVIFNDAGEVVADSREASESKFPTRQEWFSTRSTWSRNVLIDSSGKAWLFTFRVTQEGYRVIVAMPRPKFQILKIFRDELLRPFVQSTIIASLLALLLSFWIAQWVSAPLRKIGTATRDIANGEYKMISPEGPEEIRALVNVFNDMSNRVKLSQQAQRDFVANVSHELKTPLTSIQGFSQAMMDGTIVSNDERKRAVEIIFSESSRMHRLVLDLLDLAKFDSDLVAFEFSQVDINKLVTDVVENLKPLAQESNVNIMIKTEIINLVECDKDRIAQILTNLMDNAIKFTPAGGCVGIHTKNWENIVEISIRDSGPGIPPRDIERIFERFYQIDKARPGGIYRGVGLGLAIAHEIVLRHNGTISVINNITPGGDIKGCTFYVRLPVVQKKEMCS